MTSLVVDGSELLVTEGMGPIMWGCYPMAPFAGRIRDGRFSFDGRDHRLPTNLPPHAIHGTVLERAWEVDAVVHGARYGEATLSIDLGPDWPFAGRVTQRVVLGSAGLKATLTLAADESMPAAMGWHPWFRRVLTGSAERSDGASSPAELRFEPGCDVRARSRRPADRPARAADERTVGRLLHGVPTPPRLLWPDGSPWSSPPRAITGWSTPSPSTRSASSRRPGRPARSSWTRRSSRRRAPDRHDDVALVATRGGRSLRRRCRPRRAAAAGRCRRGSRRSPRPRRGRGPQGLTRAANAVSSVS